MGQVVLEGIDDSALLSHRGERNCRGQDIGITYSWIAHTALKWNYLIQEAAGRREVEQVARKDFGSWPQHTEPCRRNLAVEFVPYERYLLKIWSDRREDGVATLQDLPGASWRPVGGR